MTNSFTLSRALLLLTMLVFASCATDEIDAQIPQKTIDENLKGSWDVDSYLINGAEQIGAWIIESNMDFQGLHGETGTLYWKNITQNGGIPVPSYYSVSDINSKVYIKNDEYSAEFKGDQLHLKGLINGVPKEIVATKSN